ncbi:MAG TPA: class I SAM-dependent RNA methyltransferase [Spirochaetota bacterium]|nr:class I SAM-dependent RNA methyltransferase [Spirochaetota bacterium]HOD14179.1 class I SAM-dependent RNA methyltransferase [Spirochaetota bacterium]HPN13119.1 class I SAM-dependent RNA methyltransferase [Spirochaetota bacterium]
MSGKARILQIEIEKAVFGGLFLGRHEGKAVLVPNAVPGETVTVRILSEKKDYCTGEIENVISGPGDRVIPACPLYNRCGGCSYLHVPYKKELEFKKNVLMDSLARIAGLDPDSIPGPVVIHEDRFHYRSHASIKARGGVSGFFRRGTNDIVPIAETGCLLLDNAVNERLMHIDAPPDDYRAAVDCSGAVVTSFDGDPLVREREAELSFSRGIDQFFQANRFLRSALLEHVVSLARCDKADTFLDIGCGVGFFTLPLARVSKHGHGIDINAESIRFARMNAAENGITNVDFEARHSSRLHPGRLEPRVMVMDPPRAGIDRHTRKTILVMGPRVIVYVSCNPSTFARDVKDFIAVGYRLETLMLADMFPCTQHVEVISRLTR